MLTVIVCLVGSGNSSTRRPLGRRYSVMPSTDVTRSAFCARAPVLNMEQASVRAHIARRNSWAIVLPLVMNNSPLKIFGAAETEQVLWFLCVPFIDWRRSLDKPPRRRESYVTLKNRDSGLRDRRPCRIRSSLYDGPRRRPRRARATPDAP